MKSYSDFEKLRGGKGFYIALAVCFAALVMSVGGIYYTAKKRVTDRPTENIVTTAEYTTAGQAADARKNDVKDERTTEPSTARTEPTEKPAVREADTQINEAEESEPYVMPMGTELSKDYSENAPVYSKTMNDWRIHPGIDFAGKKGEEVLSISNGKVKKIYSDEKWGTVAEISYGVSLTVRYCGLEQGTTVKVDDVVGRGEVIGVLGDIPCESLDGAHLHLETLVDGEYEDPLAVLGMSESTFSD